MILLALVVTHLAFAINGVQKWSLPGYANLMGIPGTLFFFYILWSMLRDRHWYWLMASIFCAPVTLVVFYVRVVRPRLGVQSARPPPGQGGQP